ncbi:polysaccharide deacetylase family protein [Neobacillus kokaensis]|uniref:Polysaccharide deacetylase n=1 Tax=Neobacillus kokaensis TaxID=2759023 RepID=A0ABQ3N375_9BACI|nr:polysaccharide deacetylase [Neobacillus kokaensis]GHH99374.1 polysaccharide deacetylase [Neobacillus kokaensis]
MEKKVFVSLTFDVDGETLWTSRDPNNWQRPVALSHGTYGPRVGLPRILRLLQKYSIEATFFVPGWIIEQYESNIKEIVEAGHEIGHHGYLHEYPDTLTEEKEREILQVGIDRITELTGRKPMGYRSPAWEFSPRTMDYLKEFDFKYSSNMMDDDQPYIHSNGIVELPVHWLMDDAPFFLFHPKVPGRVIQPTEAVFNTWKDEFSALYEEGKSVVLTFHPQMIGRAHRVQYLEEFIKFILDHPGVEFTTCEKLAKYTKEAMK